MINKYITVTLLILLIIGCKRLVARELDHNEYEDSYKACLEMVHQHNRSLALIKSSCRVEAEDGTMFWKTAKR